jgi:hypothetical protein
MQSAGRKWFYAFCIIAIVYILFSLIGVQIGKRASPSERTENIQWIATGKFWADRELCGWFGVCGLFHMVNTAGWTWSRPRDGSPPTNHQYGRLWNSSEEDPDSWSREEKKLREIPQYVLDYAPYVHLFSREEFWPSDLAEHLEHTRPSVNYSHISNLGYALNLTSLRDLNDYGCAEYGRYMYLESNENVEERPKWLVSARNIPAIAESEGESDAWPSALKVDEYQHQTAEQKLYDSPEDKAHHTTERVASQDGRCGGSSGFTCTGSRFGPCCSIYGWCGGGEAHCADACDPLAGTCYNPYAPPQGPKQDLRKRSIHGQHKPRVGGRSTAPAFLIVVPKEDGIVDAFWFFFYSFNLGQKVFNIRFGNHLGDWEHTAVRFQNGQPIEVFLSEHEWGDAYTWNAIEKYIPAQDGSGTMIGTWSNKTASLVAKRPVVYSAIGSHAMYGTPGLQPYILPFGILHDETDRGPLWDPTLNLQSYTYDPANQKLRASLLNPKSPTGWFDFAGHWGEKYLKLGDARQYRLAGQYHYVNGPLGPKFKNLGRSTVCQNAGKPCNVKTFMTGQWRPHHALNDDDEGEDGGLPGGNHTDEAVAKADLKRRMIVERSHTEQL